MQIESGAVLAHYEITGPLGKGGMGEVYRAKDAKLRRDVAIKVLPDEFTRDPERLGRFEREAHVLASLDHPHIASIYGFEEAGGVRFLVMQLAPGEDLSDRMARGAIPVEESIAIARQLAEALEAAHDRGIVHRDLKPANVKVDDDGNVKVLDFGLAKALETDESTEELSNSPTMIRAVTHAGMILGTAAYMSPEQARGKRVDKRADIWAFGVILWEMLTGRRLFEGQTVSDTLAAVLREEPDMDALPPETPLSVRRLLRRCLEKHPKQRLHDIADARLELDDSGAEAESADREAPAVGPRRLWLALPWTLAVLAVVLALGGWLNAGPDESVTEQARVVAKIPPPPDVSFLVSRGFALSPDGSMIAFWAREAGGIDQLYVRSLDRDVARPLTGTAGGRHPFWSPDSRSIGFFADERLKTLNLDSGVVETHAEVTRRAGGAWNRHGIILVSGRDSLFRLRVSDGQVEQMATGELEHLFPSFLPDGEHFLYLARDYIGKSPTQELRVASLDGATQKVLMSINSNALLAPNGQLLWWESGNLRAQHFDTERLELTGEVSLVAAGVEFDPRVGLGMFSVSNNGLLAYRQGGTISGDQMVLVDREGRDVAPVGPPGNYYHPRLSPDGSRVAVDRSEETNRGDIWIYDVERGMGTRLTSDPRDESDPAWSPDGSRLAFSSTVDAGYREVHVRSLRGSGGEEALAFGGETSVFPIFWTSTEYVVAERSEGSAGSTDLWIYEIDEKSAAPYAESNFEEARGAVSPDGGYMAYSSNETGRFEVYVETFPEPGNRWRVSTDGGTDALWGPDGRELYYVDSAQQLWAVPVRWAPDRRDLGFGAPQPLFRTDFKLAGSRQYDTIDGQVFLVNRSVGEEDEKPLTLVVNAFGPLSR